MLPIGAAAAIVIAGFGAVFAVFAVFAMFVVFAAFVVRRRPSSPSTTTLEDMG